MLIVLFVSAFKGAVSQCAEGAKIFAILFENNLVVRTSQQSLLKWVWAFSQPAAVPNVTHPEA